MRPCKHCGIALENQMKVCPACGAGESSEEKPSPPACSPNVDQPDDGSWVLWLEYLGFPLFAGILFGGAMCAASGPWGIAAGVGVFLACLMLRVGGDLL
tara:strand:+ start:295392 stop:295688 length:297 start_codon:yes stop_codon:yes gene_type:complete